MPSQFSDRAFRLSPLGVGDEIAGAIHGGHESSKMGSPPPSAQRRRLGARSAEDRVRLDANPRYARPGEKDVSSDVAEALTLASTARFRGPRTLRLTRSIQSMNLNAITS